MNDKQKQTVAVLGIVLVVAILFYKFGVPTQPTQEQLYEVELGSGYQIDLLSAELDVTVLGRVISTERSGVEIDAWHDGAWQTPLDRAHGADTTLGDRYIVSCIEAKAIELSTHLDWVQWVAPALEGTTYEGGTV